MKDTIDFVVMVSVGVGLGIAIGLAIWGGVPDGFQCTESSVVDGVVECVKYEKRVN